MIEFELKEDKYGPYIIGDTLTLKWLHYAIHDLGENCFCDSIMDEDGGIFAFAYHVRHALQHNRKKYPAKKDPELPTRYGFDLPWPLLLYWVKVLQESVLRQDPSKFVKSIIFHLEVIVELALKEDFKNNHHQIMHAWQNMDVSKKFCHDAIFTRVNYYEQASSKDRSLHIVDVIESLDYNWCDSYKNKPKKNKDCHLDPAIYALPKYAR
ncbi:DUF6904 family protein [Pseudomonas viridiflava]|uniref:DUF6904 family protein n=1 Tax=Pseudomonas viridiflava TaxID=33069 RepID=UPI000F044871|nr:hypothetical protein [Pseudomonas viridiflava]